jgi:hypothetical protein
MLRSKLLLAASVALAFAVWGVMVQSSRSQPPAAPVTEVHPPADQSYVGYKACMACHLKQTMAWKKTKHFTEAFAKLPAKYQADPSCLACHSTGYGAATGYKDASTETLAGTTCEACHGPASAHVAAAKPFISAKPTPEQTEKIKGTIYKVMPNNVCIRCHADQGHKAHPAYDK